jgi:hypothetical protein
MGMQRESRFVITPIRGTKVVQQQKRIEVIECLRANAPLQLYPRAFDHGLGLDDSLDVSW